MFQPRRSVRSIQPLPSIYTAFSNNKESETSENSGKCLIRQIEDGIEVVPFERDCLSAPILSPEQDEKEVFITSQQELKPSEKPLPRLPKTLWGRLSVKQRIVAIICVQAALLLTIGLSLMAAGKNRPNEKNQRVKLESTDDISLQNSSMVPLSRGTFSVPIQAAQQQSSACLARSNESIAWQCASDTMFQINILPSSATSNTTLITLGPLSRPNATAYHGHQAPEIRLVAVTPIKTTEGSEAYHFRTTYDRVVLLKSSDLATDGKPQPQPIMRHPSFNQGETLWRCTFNETVIEGFIYPNKSTINIDGTNNNTTTMPQLPIIPHAMKLVEQRMPNGKGPYCEKVMLSKDGKMPRMSQSKIMLGLAEPSAEVDAAEKELLRSRLFRKARRRASAANYCSCQWMVQ